MPEIRLETKLRVPADLAAGALGSILEDIAGHRGPWRGFALHVGLGELRLPDVGYVAVPIDLQVKKDPKVPDAFDVHFSAENLPAAFPVFTGTLTLEPGDLGESSLHLNGSYELPFHIFGKLLDKAMMPHIAEKSLQNFLLEMASACQAHVDRREAEFAQYLYYTHSQR